MVSCSIIRSVGPSRRPLQPPTLRTPLHTASGPPRHPQGNTTSHKHGPESGPEHESYARPHSPPLSPGSPLTYSPQMPMEPLARAEEAAGRQGPEFHGLAGWPAQPKLMPVVIVCEWQPGQGQGSWGQTCNGAFVRREGGGVWGVRRTAYGRVRSAGRGSNKSNEQTGWEGLGVAGLGLGWPISCAWSPRARGEGNAAAGGKEFRQGVTWRERKELGAGISFCEVHSTVCRARPGVSGERLDRVRGSTQLVGLVGSGSGCDLGRGGLHSPTTL